MERTRVAQIKDGKARFRYLMCPYCVAVCNNDQEHGESEGLVSVRCPNCSRDFFLYEDDYARWSNINVA